MKKILLNIIALSVGLQADLSVDQIKDMVNKIHERREGISLSTLANTKEPFVRFVSDENTSKIVIPVAKNEEVRLSLHAVVNGKAYINDSWVEVGDKVLGYELKYIGKRGVVLRNENHIKKLFLRKNKNSFIKIKERY